MPLFDTNLGDKILQISQVLIAQHQATQQLQLQRQQIEEESRYRGQVLDLREQSLQLKAEQFESSMALKEQQFAAKSAGGGLAPATEEDALKLQGLRLDVAKKEREAAGASLPSSNDIDEWTRSAKADEERSIVTSFIDQQLKTIGEKEGGAQIRAFFPRFSSKGEYEAFRQKVNVLATQAGSQPILEGVMAIPGMDQFKVSTNDEAMRIIQNMQTAFSALDAAGFQTLKLPSETDPIIRDRVSERVGVHAEIIDAALERQNQQKNALSMLSAIPRKQLIDSVDLAAREEGGTVEALRSLVGPHLGTPSAPNRAAINALSTLLSSRMAPEKAGEVIYEILRKQE